MELRIVDYNESYRDSLFTYMRKTFPTYKDEYIEYCIDKSGDRQPSKLVVDENDVICGCHLYYCTKACIKGEIIETQWGHDTYLDKDARPLIGPDFIMTLFRIKAFGVGLTQVNSNINKKLKKVFFPGVYNYYTINRKFIRGVIATYLSCKQTPVNYPDVVKVNGIALSLTKDAGDMPSLNNGFWYKDSNDIDFVRDWDFLNKRFLNNKVHDYRVYSCNKSGSECYFVVRKSEYRNIPALTISDFRYNPLHPELTKSIFKAVHKIALQNKFGIVYFVCGDKNMDNALKCKLHYNTPMEFVTANKLSADSSYSLTGADSDIDFLKA